MNPLFFARICAEVDFPAPGGPTLIRLVHQFNNGKKEFTFTIPDNQISFPGLGTSDLTEL